MHRSRYRDGAMSGPIGSKRAKLHHQISFFPSPSVLRTLESFLWPSDSRITSYIHNAVFYDDQECAPCRCHLQACRGSWEGFRPCLGHLPRGPLLQERHHGCAIDPFGQLCQAGRAGACRVPCTVHRPSSIDTATRLATCHMSRRFFPPTAGRRLSSPRCDGIALNNSEMWRGDRSCAGMLTRESPSLPTPRSRPSTRPVATGCTST